MENSLIRIIKKRANERERKTIQSRQIALSAQHQTGDDDDY